ncbi:GDSL esterase/lipase CPRD49-like isoform X1 [Carex littledalei]|uniref:GDSL esterase/lipase CPRD49-like isoform X1 n=1 Tax=Carex littledalei TaxID=544730 RepID=A0A833VP51_9POAL|nr:GDSL esterase/lipase CPRD49-like isoform X1 [Carex littledalei]
MAGPERPVIVLFGSSFVQYSFSNGGWGAILADVYARKADIVVRGYQGWNSRRALEVIDKVFPKDAAVQPSLVIVYFGGNDSIGKHPSGLGPHVPLEEYVENMRKIANHIKSLSQTTRLIMLSCPPVNENILRNNKRGALTNVSRTNEVGKRYSDALIMLCKEMKIEAIDAFHTIQRRDDWETACIMSDGIHLTEEASKLLAGDIFKVIKNAKWEPSLYWKSLPTEFAEPSDYYVVAPDGKSTINQSDWTYHRKIRWD